MSAQEELHTMDRRRFLKLSGILGVGFATAGLLPTSESVAFNRKLYKVTKTRPGMGTFVSITLMHPSKTESEEVIGKAFEEMDRVISLMDRYRPDSPIGLLNKEGRLADYAREALGPARVNEVGVFDAAKISQLVAKAERLPEGRGGTRNSLAFVQALSTQLLHELFIKRKNPRSTTEGTYHVIDDTRASS